MNLPEADQELEALLAYLKQERSCDLTSYQRSTLIRQFDLRMQRLNINSYLAYLDYLQCHDEEWTALLDNALISFTGFFYDRPAWECIANDILPRILASKQPNEHIRVWSAGCASGQEVYSLVMLFAEALGIESCLKRVQFYATDIDVAVLQQARKAIYSRSEVGEIPTALLNKYFKQTSQGYVFHRKLRATVIFGQHNLAIDAPVSRIDLLVCRNALIYWGIKTQVSVLIRFHFALQTNGFLLLGKAETLTNRHQIFKPFNVKQRIYTKEIDLKLDDQPVTEPPLPVLDRAPPASEPQAIEPRATDIYIWQAAYETSAFAQLAIDNEGCLVVANERAAQLFGLTLADRGQPIEELEPGRLLKFHTAAHPFYQSYHSTVLKDVRWITPKKTNHFDISIRSILDSNQRLLQTHLTFIETTQSKSLESKLEHRKAVLRETTKALEETQAALNTARFELASIRKELETTQQEIFFDVKHIN